MGKEDRSEGSEGWRGASMHLLDSILDKLNSTKEVLQFGVVCNAWHSVLKDNQSRIANSPRHYQNNLPMLLVPDVARAWLTYDVAAGEFLSSKPCVSRDKRFCGSSMGWLAEVNPDWSVTLRNPFSASSSEGKSVFSLPPVFPPLPEDIDPNVQHSVDFVKYHDRHVKKVLITADPLRNADDCLVVVIFWDMDDIALISLTAGEQSTWSRTPNSRLTQDIMMTTSTSRRLLYTVNFRGEVYSLNPNPNGYNDSYSPTQKLVSPTDNLIRSRIKRYLVESPDGKIYLIRRHYTFDDEDYGQDRRTLRFKVFRLNLETGKRKAVRSIRDYAIFLGENSSVCVRASSFKGCQRNSIYFTHDMDSESSYGRDLIYNDLGVYDVSTKELEFHLSLDSAKVRQMGRKYPIWVVPTLDLY